MSLAATKRPIVQISPQRSNHCRLKRLKPEQEIGPLGPQYDETKILCRTATRWDVEINPEAVIADLRGDEVETNL
jgi:hypothetical protein